MKYFFTIIVCLFIIFNRSYSYIMPLLETDVIKNVKVTNGLYVSQNLGFSYNQLKAQANTKIFYRLPLFTSHSNAIFQNAKIDMGIENKFTTSGELIGGFANFTPFSFFSLRVSAYFNLMHDAFNMGYLPLDTGNTDAVSAATFFATDKSSAVGFSFSVTPMFYYSFKHVLVANILNLNFITLGDAAFYYDENTARIHAKNDLEIENDLYLMGNINPFYIGVYYGALHLVNANATTHRFGVALALALAFLEDESLTLDVGLSAGTHLGLKDYDNLTFIDIQARLDYRIPLELLSKKKEMGTNDTINNIEADTNQTENNIDADTNQTINNIEADNNQTENNINSDDAI